MSNMSKEEKEEVVGILKSMMGALSALGQHLSGSPKKDEPVKDIPTQTGTSTSAAGSELVMTAARSHKKMGDFVKVAKDTWGMKRDDARDMWRGVHGKTKRIVNRKSKDDVASTEPLVPPVAPLEPQPVPAPEAATLTPPTDKTQITGTLISAVPPAGANPQTLPNLSAPSAQDVLKAIEATANTFISQGKYLDAITYIRQETGFGLTEAKLWIDIIRGMVTPEGGTDPIVLKTAKDEFIRRKMIDGKPTLGEQVATMRKETTDKEMDPVAGRAEGQKKIDLAGDKKSELVQIARRFARTLAANGPITIDDVTRAMSTTYNVLPVTGKRLHMWKGSVFTKSEWRYIGDIPSSQKSAHARPVGLWALKTWLSKNTLNGKDTQVSSYILTKLYKDFERKYPTVDMSKCNCLIGEECIADESKKMIMSSGNKLYHTPVTFVPGTIGAMISLPVVPAMFQPAQPGYIPPFFGQMGMPAGTGQQAPVAQAQATA